MFVFNRPEHTSKVIEGLKKNKINRLYVFADGPRNNNDINLIKETRELINNIDWCEVILEESEQNKGLAESVINGVSKVFSSGYDSVIVVEDDCVPNENFIQYMRQTLNYYKDNEEVMHVSGFGLPIKKHTNADVFLSPYPCSWGWGTWSRYWENCDFYQIDSYNNLLANEKLISKFNYSGAVFSDFLKMQLDGKINSWLIRWYFYIFSQNGKCVWSYSSFIENKGFDGTGAHKVNYDRFNQRKTNSLEKAVTQIIYEDELVYDIRVNLELRRYFNGKGIWEKLKSILYLTSGIIIESRKRVRAAHNEST